MHRRHFSPFFHHRYCYHCSSLSPLPDITNNNSHCFFLFKCNCYTGSHCGFPAVYYTRFKNVIAIITAKNRLLSHIADPDSTRIPFRHTVHTGLSCLKAMTCSIGVGQSDLSVHNSMCVVTLACSNKSHSTDPTENPE